MKRMGMALLLLLLLSGCGKQDAVTCYGTVETATGAQVYQDELYYLSPVGCVDENTGVASYSWETGAGQQVATLDGADVKHFCVTEQGIYLASDSALFHVSGTEVVELYRVPEDWQITWLLAGEGTLYFCRCTYEDTPVTEIMALDPETGEATLVVKREDTVFQHGAMVCCYEGKLYGHQLGNEIHVLELSTGKTETMETEQAVSALYATSKGVVVSYGDERDDFYLLDGTAYGPAVQGECWGADENSLYFLQKQALSGTILQQQGDKTQVLWDGFQWDMVTEPCMFAAGGYVLFYTMDALTEDAKEEELYHNLYLLNVKTGEIRCIGGYLQDYLYS